MFDRAILHMDLDAFFVSVERLRRPDLRGRPIIIGGHGLRAVVASCSYEARACGVRSAMPVSRARQLCPQAVILDGDLQAYGSFSRWVSEIIAEEAPLYERASIDEFYLDLSGMDRYLGCWSWAVALRRRIQRETGLPISMGLAVNKLVAKVATGRAKPNGQLLVLPGEEQGFLAPLPIEEIPGIGHKTAAKLHRLGVKRVAQLAAYPLEQLEALFGKQGVSIWRKARGLGSSTLEPHSERKSISSEHTFDVDVADREVLNRELTRLVGKLGYLLRGKGRLASSLAVKLRYADFTTVSHQQKIPYTANDKLLLAYARGLFERHYQAHRPLRLIGCRLAGLLRGSEPLQLFDWRGREMKLLSGLDEIRDKFGQYAIRRASELALPSKTERRSSLLGFVSSAEKEEGCSEQSESERQQVGGE